MTNKCDQKCLYKTLFQRTTGVTGSGNAKIKCSCPHGNKFEIYWEDHEKFPGWNIRRIEKCNNDWCMCRCL